MSTVAADAPAVGNLPGISLNTNLAHIDYREMVQRSYVQGDAEGGLRNAIRLVPLLWMHGEAGSRHIAVGNVRIVVGATMEVSLEVALPWVWQESSQLGLFKMLGTEAGTDEDALAAVGELVMHFLKPIAQATAEHPETRASKIAKDLAEKSRNTTAGLREVRYLLEQQLADFSEPASYRTSQSSVVSALLQLNVICGRAADGAREAVREGMWLHLTDSEGYHFYRRLQDPTIFNAHPNSTAASRPWMKLHDSGVRQCAELRNQLEAESASVRSLLASAASVSSSREADAQANFNTLAAVASLGLGIPALVLALYSAERLLPLDTAPRQLAFLPVALGLVFAAVLAIVRAPRGPSGRVWLFGAVTVLVALLSLLITAGMLAPMG